MNEDNEVQAALSCLIEQRKIEWNAQRSKMALRFSQAIERLAATQIFEDDSNELFEDKILMSRPNTKVQTRTNRTITSTPTASYRREKKGYSPTEAFSKLSIPAGVDESSPFSESCKKVEI